jgi:glycosyltransferase involved in cell wall biosynthesis
MRSESNIGTKVINLIFHLRDSLRAMKVLYLTYDGLTDPLGQSQILPYLTGLAALGHEIHIVSFEKPHQFKLLGNNIAKQCKEANLNFYPQVYHKQPLVISTIIDIRKMKSVAFALHQSLKFNLVHCRSYIPALVGLSLKEKKKLPLIFDMRGFYADERVDGKLWPQNNLAYKLIYKYFKQKELELLQRADAIISLTTAARTIMGQKKMTGSNAPVSVIPCCVDTSHFNRNNIDTPETENLRKKLGYSNQTLILGYVGSTGTWYLLDDMLQYFKMLHAAKPEARFLFLSMDDAEIIKTKAAALGIDPELIQVVSVNRSELPRYYALFNLSVFFIMPAFSKIASSPTKQGELMSMGIPIVCNAGVGDTEEIINQYEAGICIPDTSTESLMKAVEATNNLVLLNKERIIFGARHYYSLQNGINSLDSIYRQIAQ